MNFELATHLSPEEVIEKAAEFYREHTGLEIQVRGADRLEFSGAIGSAKIKAYREHGHTTVRAETDRGVGLDVTDVTLRFLYTIPHV
ncbi:MAG: hypothetical protein JSV86_12160 [Gemmatimonadota bacterium]|nr:MAG: hypothetical protein JSV86_12160 [Gemmatimonadota bacterium]